ncbi:hypothetical protein KUV62_09820 [Salipiger bermudensis]|uniref:hypothetical protein n=1 Tax=Salipiger bermudensis TaxID=344736 RepID=UPI001C9901EE|nr:hypothetical protein [Salipiger bermudensis]MBY6004206.1 hypothetical protein [Salipiger bermudensis]
MLPMPTYWGFAAMQMGVQMMSLQMRMAQAVYEAGVMQQKAFWGVRPPLASVLPSMAAMRGPVSMGICGPVAIAGGGRPLPRPRAGRSSAALKAVPSSAEVAPKTRRHRAPSTPPEMPVAVAAEGGDDKTPV